MLILIKAAIDTRQAVGCVWGMHSKVQRSATDALCVMKSGQEGGGKKEDMLCVYVVCFWQINEPCEGECSALWSCHMHSKQRRSQGGEVKQGAVKGTPLHTPLACHYTCVNTALHNTVAHTLV